MWLFTVALLVVVICLLLSIRLRLRSVRIVFHSPSEPAPDYINPLPASSRKRGGAKILRDARAAVLTEHGTTVSADKSLPDTATEDGRQEAEYPLSPLLKLTPDGVAWIADTNVKVIEVAVDKLAHGSSPEEMHFQYPHLSLAQIHAALAYYYDHQAEMDAEIRTRRAEANELAAELSDGPLRQRLLKLKQERGG